MIPTLLEVPQLAVTDSLRTLLSHGVKAGGLNLKNTETGAYRLFQSLVEASQDLVTSLLANATLDSVQLRVYVRKAGTDARK